MISNILGPEEIESIQQSSTSAISTLLENIDTTEYDYLQNLTVENKNEQVWISLNTLVDISPDNAENLFQKLSEYRFIHSLNHLKRGKFVRWLPTVYSTSYKLSYGGVVVDIEIGDNGPMILCKTPVGRLVKYDYNSNLTYQKMSQEEKLILMANSS